MPRFESAVKASVPSSTVTPCIAVLLPVSVNAPGPDLKKLPVVAIGLAMLASTLATTEPEFRVMIWVPSSEYPATSKSIRLAVIAELTCTLPPAVPEKTALSLWLLNQTPRTPALSQFERLVFQVPAPPWMPGAALGSQSNGT